MKKWGFPFVCLWLLVMVPLPAAANAAPGPDLTLVVMGGPEDLTVDIVKTDGVNQGRIHLEGAHTPGRGASGWLGAALCGKIYV